MLEHFSRRAARIIMEARIESGKRGANHIDVNSLIIGFITEEQDPNSRELNDQGRKKMETTAARAMLLPAAYWEERGPSFLPQEVAAGVLDKLREILPPSNPIPDAAEISTSPEFDRALSVAEHLRQELHRAKVEPLSLLAAALKESCEASKLLIDADVTEERALQFLRSGGAPE